MATYRGPATAILEDGTEVPVFASFNKTTGGIESWEGSIAPTDPAHTYVLMPDPITIRMPDGTEASALLTNVNTNITSDGGSVRARILGNGVAPF